MPAAGTGGEEAVATVLGIDRDAATAQAPHRPRPFGQAHDLSRPCAPERDEDERGAHGEPGEEQRHHPILGNQRNKKADGHPPAAQENQRMYTGSSTSAVRAASTIQAQRGSSIGDRRFIAAGYTTPRSRRAIVRAADRHPSSRVQHIRSRTAPAQRAGGGRGQGSGALVGPPGRQSSIPHPAATAVDEHRQNDDEEDDQGDDEGEIPERHALVLTSITSSCHSGQRVKSPPSATRLSAISASPD